MSEVITLVSWNEPEEIGKLAGSEWVCPVGRLDQLGDFDRTGGTVTDEVIKDLAAGRPQHLEMIQYPEGYQAGKIVDSETGEVLTDGVHSNRYAGLSFRYDREAHGTPSVRSMLSEKPIDLENGKQLSSVDNFSNGTQTVITPTSVGSSEPDYIGRLRTRVNITPQARALYMLTEGRVSAIDGCCAMFEVCQNASKVKSELVISARNESGETPDELNLKLDANGQIVKLRAYKRNLLDKLGVNIDTEFDPLTDGAEISDPDQRTLVLDALSEALGLGRPWKGLDLKLTASGLYAAMGQRNLDPSTVLVPRS